MTLQHMSQEYRANTALLELRITQLNYQLAHTPQPEVRRRLRHRVGALRVMLGEGRQTGYLLDHYYDASGQEG